MSTAASRLYNFVTDKNAGTAITASRVDGELDAIITKLNQKAIIAASAPSGPIAGMLWLDSTNKYLKQYRNSEWVIMSPVHVGTAAPATVQEGDLWYDSTNNVLKAYDGSNWYVSDMAHPASTAAGDVLYYTAAKTLARLAKGTEGQLLRMNVGATAPAWGDGFVGRDPAALDYAVGALTTDGATHDLNLSAIVPVGAKAVLFAVGIQDDATNKSFTLYKKGQTYLFNYAGGNIIVVNLPHYFEAVVECDANRVVSYIASNTTWAIIDITVRGWWF